MRKTLTSGHFLHGKLITLTFDPETSAKIDRLRGNMSPREFLEKLINESNK